MENAEMQLRLERKSVAAIAQWWQLDDVRIMNPNAEDVLSAILAQYDDSDGNKLSFEAGELQSHLLSSCRLQGEKLNQRGMLTNC